MTVAELGDRMSARELAEWEAFDMVEPIGGPAANHRAGQICATIANVHRTHKQPPVNASQFFPEPAPRRRRSALTLDQLDAALDRAVPKNRAAETP